MIYIYLLLAIWYFEYGVRAVEIAPVIPTDWNGHDIDIEDDLFQYRFLVITIIIMAGVGSVFLTFSQLFKRMT